MNNNKFYLKFTREQRSGIFVLLFLIVLIQILYYVVLSKDYASDPPDPEEEKWLALQSRIDSLKAIKDNETLKIYPFNPNFISDYKGYTLGMTTEEIDRLHAFRKQHKFVNSPKEFQDITKVSDEKLAEIAPYFKFPEWVNSPGPARNYGSTFKEHARSKEKDFIIDINKATKEDLMKVYGIGPALSERILAEKEKLGAFVSTQQFQYIWGLSPEVVQQLIVHFPVLQQPPLQKIDINNSSLKDLAQFPYFRFALAKEIVTYRSMNGGIKSKEDLTKIKDFPVEKVDIIALYLDF